MGDPFGDAGPMVASSLFVLEGAMNARRPTSDAVVELAPQTWGPLAWIILALALLAGLFAPAVSSAAPMPAERSQPILEFVTLAR